MNKKKTTMRGKNQKEVPCRSKRVRTDGRTHTHSISPRIVRVPSGVLDHDTTRESKNKKKGKKHQSYTNFGYSITQIRLKSRRVPNGSILLSAREGVWNPVAPKGCFQVPYRVAAKQLHALRTMVEGPLITNPYLTNIYTCGISIDCLFAQFDLTDSSLSYSVFREPGCRIRTSPANASKAMPDHSRMDEIDLKRVI
jgi:hypothetical protein